MRVEDSTSYGKDILTYLEDIPLKSKIKVRRNNLIFNTEVFNLIASDLRTWTLASPVWFQ
jgi:hypothetical protein